MDFKDRVREAMQPAEMSDAFKVFVDVLNEFAGEIEREIRLWDDGKMWVKMQRGPLVAMGQQMDMVLLSRRGDEAIILRAYLSLKEDVVALDLMMGEDHVFCRTVGGLEEELVKFISRQDVRARMWIVARTSP